ncbi:MAG: DsbA family protein [Anaerolineaceae bacterium]|nr:MAG: DsbA family protein [Anaerolineaceae bacterium]
MPNEQGKSKRQQLREKRQREQQRTRIFSIGAVIVGALLLAFLFIYPNIKPVGDVVSIAPGAYPQNKMNAMGDPDAPVKLETWEDFQCPACKNFSEDVESLLIQNYIATGKVYYMFHHYPFIDDYSASSESDQAANASMCAGEQGRFWDYKSILFANWNGENIGAFSDRRLLAFGESLGLEMKDFEACFNANTYKAQIDQDFADGISLGVNSTPSVFVNGILVVNPNGANLVPSYDDVVAAIEAALATAE